MDDSDVEAVRRALPSGCWVIRVGFKFRASLNSEVVLMPTSLPVTQAPARFVMIGGFLGAGKTTAIIKFAEYLKGKGKRVGLITNDQSIDLVDTARVKAAGFPVEEITGGCFCCKFESLVDASATLTK